MSRALLFGLGVVLGLGARAGGDPIPVGARLGGMGNAGTTLIDLWSVRLNQAGLAGLERPTAGMYFQNHWLSEELSMKGLAVALPLGNGTIAISGSDFGYSLYREQQFGVAYAMRFGDGLRAAVQLDYLSTRLGENYGSSSAVMAELGMQARLTEDLWIGAHLYNPGGATLGGPYDEKIPTLLRVGLGYTFSDKLQMTADVVKDIDRKEQLRMGLEYHPNEVLFIRTGFSTAAVQGHVGVGVRFGQFDMDMAVSFNGDLGATPQLNLNYRFK